MFPPLLPHFQSIPLPGPGDWLTEQKEPSQTLSAFTRGRYNRMTSTCQTIYILPLGEFDPQKTPSLTVLQQFASAFFQTAVVQLPVVAENEKKGSKPARVYFPAPLSPDGFQNPIGVRTRTHHGSKQLLTQDLFSVMEQYLPDDAYCMIAVTMTDLYPKPEWNFVFGEASLRGRMGVFSFARYSPLFANKKKKSELTPQQKTVLLRRSCRVMVHELAHMFSMEHCLFFACVMNGANNLEEDDKQPLFLCPVCLAKLYMVRPFDLIARYKALHAVCLEQSMDREASWLQTTISDICSEP